MLVLTRKKDQTIKVKIPPSDRERTLEVMVVFHDNHKVRLGLTAPRSLSISRPEAEDKRKG